jgi:hypothetical protein
MFARQSDYPNPYIQVTYIFFGSLCLRQGVLLEADINHQQPTAYNV